MLIFGFTYFTPVFSQALRLKSAASGCVVRTLALGREFQTPAGKKVTPQPKHRDDSDSPNRPERNVK
jgi:hypothetical protein